MRLEVGDGSDGQLNVITPAGDHRVGFDPSVSMRLEIGEEGLPHAVLQGATSFLKSGNQRCSYECVLIFDSVS